MGSGAAIIIGRPPALSVVIEEGRRRRRRRQRHFLCVGSFEFHTPPENKEEAEEVLYDVVLQWGRGEGKKGCFDDIMLCRKVKLRKPPRN